MEVTGVCPACKQPFAAVVNSGRRRRYCSEACRPSSPPAAKPKALPPAAAKAPPAAAEGHSPLTADVIYDDEQAQWLRAVQAWQKRTGKKFPTHCDFLAIALGAGYRKPTPPPEPKE